jgi:hypothetical protein
MPDFERSLRAWSRGSNFVNLSDEQYAISAYPMAMADTEDVFTLKAFYRPLYPLAVHVAYFRANVCGVNRWFISWAELTPNHINILFPLP